MSLVEEEEEDGPLFKVVAIFPEDFKRNAPIDDAQWFERADKRPQLPYMKFSWSKKVLGRSTLVSPINIVSHVRSGGSRQTKSLHSQTGSPGTIVSVCVCVLL